MSDQGQTKIKVVLENISHELFDKPLDLDERIASSGIPCIILQWFPGNLQEHSIFLEKVIRNIFTIHVLGEDCKSMYMLVECSGLSALMMF